MHLAERDAYDDAVPLTPLPIDELLGEIVVTFERSSNLVLSAPPGAGKTTRVPPAMLEAGLAERGKIVVLQPRRIAARATAARIAAERQWRLGNEVGYQVRFESRSGPRTKIEIVTEGILLRRLLADPFLSGVASVVFDEFHERSLASDLALAMVRQIQQSVRPELRIVVMSATLSTEPVAAYLGDCPILRSAGRQFPVEIDYSPRLERVPLAEAVAEGIEQTIDRTPGDCLVFLPGVGEIRHCQRQLESMAERAGIDVFQLYGDLPAEQQDAVLAPGKRRKIILATNVAETSLTIEGVTAVVDSGLARTLRYDERTGLDRLELGAISKASADQRAGRAGRTQPGICLRLWPEAAHRARSDFELPEIRRVDLAGAVLQVLCWIEPDLTRFPWFESPPPGAVDRALNLLRMLGAADETAVTSLGRTIASLPVHPRLGRLLVEGRRRGDFPRAALAAALLSERDPFTRSPERRRASITSRSDILDRVTALETFESTGQIESHLGTLSRNGAQHVLKTRDHLRRAAESIEGTIESSTEELLRAVLAAYPDRLAKRREPGSRRGVMVGGRGVRLADEVALADEELYVCIDVDAGTGEALVRQASAVEREWLPEEQLRTETVVEFDEASEKVIARKRLYWSTLLLEESQAGLPAGNETAQILANTAAARLEKVLPPADSDAAAFRVRVQCLREWMPELNLPPLDDDQIRSLLPTLAAGRRSFADLRSAPWLQAIKSVYSWQQLQAIEREAPERIEVPSGSRITIQYASGQPPILAVRIQEVFGLLDTPRIAGGRVPVLMHLLAPNMRVAQITSDLRSFWANGYPEVRKDLRARYPKHAWPEDPYTALPQSRPIRKR